MRASRPIRAAPLLAPTALLLALAAAGCGSTTRTVTDESPPQLTTKSVAGKGTATVGSAAVANEPVAHLGSFRSPSGNIGCVLVGGTARCDIERRSWRPPPRPAACPDIVDFGQGLEISRHGGRQLRLRG